MMGVEPIPRFLRERILSPLRLPFRHIGAAACILSFSKRRRNRGTVNYQSREKADRFLIVLAISARANQDHVLNLRDASVL